MAPPLPLPFPRIKKKKSGVKKKNKLKQVKDSEKAWMTQSGKRKERSIEGILETLPPSEQIRISLNPKNKQKHLEFYLAPLYLKLTLKGLCHVYFTNAKHRVEGII